MNYAAAVVTLGVAAGPVLAGDSVMWAEEPRNGAVRVMLAQPGGEPVLVHRVRPPAARRTRRDVIGLAASNERFAALVNTSSWIHERGDRPHSVTSTAVLGGPFGAPVELESGSLPERGEESCVGDGLNRSIDALDVDGSRLALSRVAFRCATRTFESDVTVFADGTETTLPAGGDVGGGDVALAGRFVAWVRDAFPRDEVRVHDLEAGTTVLRLRARFIDEIALQDDGTVALMYEGGLGWAAPGTPGIRQLDRRPGFDLALTEGRVLYERITSAIPWRSTLRLKPLAGGPSRRLDSFTDRRRRITDLDLSATRATWAVRQRGKPTRIVIRDL